MAVYTVIDGSVLGVSQEFLDDDDAPLIPSPGYPKVKLLDGNKDTIIATVASASSTPGSWTANLALPNFGLTEKAAFKVRWFFKASDGSTEKVYESVTVEPKIDQREGDIVFLYNDTGTFDFILPVVWDVSTCTGDIQIYYNNTPGLASSLSLNSTDVTRTVRLDSTSFECGMQGVNRASLQSHLLVVNYKYGSARKRTVTFKLWALTPQIMKGMSFIEDFLNKSKIENVIPELRYNDSDLIGYLERGLNLFNMLGYQTGFDGTNMQGVLFDCWLICACYYALGAQLLAEGSLAFDYNGQAVSLSVDRTPQLDSALGRIESQMDSRIVPLKKSLNRQGITGGDGSVGSTNMRNPMASGTLGIINAPTTRIPSYVNAGGSWLGRRR